MTLSTNSRNSFWLGLLVASGVTLSGANASAEEAKLKFYVNFIGGPEIQFFAVVQRGVEDAGKDPGSTRFTAVRNAATSTCKLSS